MRALIQELTEAIQYSGDVTWDKKTKTLSIEASDLGGKRLQRDLVIVDPRTKKKAMFTIRRTVKEKGELLYWEFWDGKTKLLVWND